MSLYRCANCGGAFAETDMAPTPSGSVCLSCYRNLRARRIFLS